MQTRKKILRISQYERLEITDDLAEEKEHNLFLNGHKVVQFLSSPKNLKELALGYLYTHHKIQKAENIYELDIRPGAIHVEAPPCSLSNKKVTKKKFSPDALSTGMEKMNTISNTFHTTGGTHSAVLFDGQDILLHFEDISRHNAILKIIGASMLQQLELHNYALLMSCRISQSVINLLEKTSICYICSQSAVTDLAVERAEELGQFVFGFMRKGRMNLYTRIQDAI
ncbi:MAG: formate dehydrogenase accessory sulfurtransferase FdhD [Bacteroidota bacterium]